MNDSIIRNIVNNEYIMDKYAQMKRKHGKDMIILFRVGEYFETYFEDSRIISGIFGLDRILLEKHFYYVIYATRIPERSLEYYRNTLYFRGYGTIISDRIRGDGVRKTHINERNRD